MGTVVGRWSGGAFTPLTVAEDEPGQHHQDGLDRHPEADVAEGHEDSRRAEEHQGDRGGGQQQGAAGHRRAPMQRVAEGWGHAFVPAEPESAGPLVAWVECRGQVVEGPGHERDRVSDDGIPGA